MMRTVSGECRLTAVTAVEAGDSEWQQLAAGSSGRGGQRAAVSLASAALLQGDSRR